MRHVTVCNRVPEAPGRCLARLCPEALDSRAASALAPQCAGPVARAGGVKFSAVVDVWQLDAAAQRAPIHGPRSRESGWTARATDTGRGAPGAARAGDQGAPATARLRLARMPERPAARGADASPPVQRGESEATVRPSRRERLKAPFSAAGAATLGTDGGTIPLVSRFLADLRAGSGFGPEAAPGDGPGRGAGKAVGRPARWARAAVQR